MTKLSFFQTLEENLKKKNLSESSINLYLRNLKKLNNDEDITNFNFLKKWQDILNKLVDLKPNTKRGYLISIVSVLNSFGDKYEKLAKTYYTFMKEIADKIKETPTTEMSEAQSNNWISWDDVKEIHTKLFNDLNIKKKNISDLQYNKLLNYVVLSVFFMLPPRRNMDWLKMLITFNSDVEDKNYNYFDVAKKQFIFNQFKTSKKDGSLTIDIPEDLFKVLSLYLEHHPLLKTKAKVKPNVPFLVFADGKPLDKINSITRLLNKVFNKKISSSMLRHIYLSSKYGDVLKEQEKDSKMMSHTVGTQHDYIKLKGEAKPDKIVVTF